MRKLTAVIGAAVVVGGIIFVLTEPSTPREIPPPVRHHHVAPPKAIPKPKPIPTPTTTPKTAPTLPTSGQAAGSASASFTVVTGEKPPVPLQIATVPWQPTTQWAVEPMGIHQGGNALVTLWFGEKAGTQAWHWWPTTFPGVPPTALPAPIAQSLTMAYSLHLGESGPTDTVGNITWPSLENEVGSPVAWTLSTVSANDSPLFAPTVAVTVFDPSRTGTFSGDYGVEAAFDAHNASTGLHGLVGFVSRTGNLASIVASPPPLL